MEDGHMLTLLAKDCPSKKKHVKDCLQHMDFFFQYLHVEQSSTHKNQVAPSSELYYCS